MRTVERVPKDYKPEESELFVYLAKYIHGSISSIHLLEEERSMYTLVGGREIGTKWACIGSASFTGRPS